MTALGSRRLLVALCCFGLTALSCNSLGAQTIRGQLMDMHTDAPIDLGLIIMVSEAGDSITSTLSSPGGRFSISTDQPGNYLLLAAALGYRETRVGLFELGDGGEMSVEFRLWPEPLSIDGIMVQSLVREPQLVRNGFYRRMQRGTGTFFTPAMLEESTETRAIDVLQGIPGTRLTIDPVNGERLQVRGARGYCTPDLIIDGVRTTWANTSIRLDELLPYDVLYAVEVHRGVAGIPIEFGSFNQCGLLVFWTARGRR
ncbi:MAG: carboxypeptidase regulatory-like domain-containing protein [Gemmatimonadota bacterium]